MYPEVFINLINTARAYTCVARAISYPVLSLSQCYSKLFYKDTYSVKLLSLLYIIYRTCPFARSTIKIYSIYIPKFGHESPAWGTEGT